MFSVTARQLDTDDDQPENYEFPSLDFEVSNSWQPRQTYEITSELASGSEVIHFFKDSFIKKRVYFQIVFNISCKARCQFKSQLQLQVKVRKLIVNTLNLRYLPRFQIILPDGLVI